MCQSQGRAQAVIILVVLMRCNHFDEQVAFQIVRENYIHVVRNESICRNQGAQENFVERVFCVRYIGGIFDIVRDYDLGLPSITEESIVVRFEVYNLNPAHSTSGMSLNSPIDGLHRRFWYSEPYLTFGEVRLRCVGHHEIYESPVIIGV